MLETTDPLTLVLAAVVGYLSGSVPYGLLFARLFGLGDIRKIGSGNIGATNALRTGNKGMAALTLAGDVLKGTVPVLVFFPFGTVPAAVAGFTAFCGHLFPVWLRFKGGKGVATYLGVLLGFAPIIVLVFGAGWLLVAWMTRFSSLAALIATLLVPIAAWIVGDQPAAILGAAMTVLVYVKHRQNIRRLIDKTETKIGAKS